MYFSSKQVLSSFKRLSSRRRTGKTHLERTSSLMYFLAFDAVCKQHGCESLDLNPQSTNGINNRKLLGLEFAKLVVLGNKDQVCWQVSELGKIHSNGNCPEKRISSNFFTVPLKKASAQSDSVPYPKRPAPVLLLGGSRNGINWRVQYHAQWRNNLPKLLLEVVEPTCFSDLAIFVLREAQFNKCENGYIEALSSLIKNKFSESLSDFWIQRIHGEKVLSGNKFQEPFANDYEAFPLEDPTFAQDRLNVLSKSELLKRISYLESVLEDRKIKFNKI